MCGQEEKVTFPIVAFPYKFPILSLVRMDGVGTIQERFPLDNIFFSDTCDELCSPTLIPEANTRITMFDPD